MIQSVLAILIGLAFTEFVFFKFLRKKLDHNFTGFLIEKCVSMIFGLGFGLLAYTLIIYSKSVNRILLSSLPLVYQFLTLAVPLFLFIWANWIFSKRMDAKK